MHITLIEIFMNLLFIGWLLFLGHIGGNALVKYIEDKAQKATKRENQNKEGKSK